MDAKLIFFSGFAIGIISFMGIIALAMWMDFKKKERLLKSLKDIEQIQRRMSEHRMDVN